MGARGACSTPCGMVSSGPAARGPPSPPLWHGPSCPQWRLCIRGPAIEALQLKALQLRALQFEALQFEPPPAILLKEIHVHKIYTTT